MEYRTLDINVISGKDLQKVNLISKMDCYAVVFIDDGGHKPTQKKKTPVSHDTDAHPTWNCPMKFTIDESAARQNRLTLVFQVRCERALGDRDVGEVRVPIKELFDSPASTDGKQQFVNYQVRKPSGKPKGEISLSYKIGEKVAGPEPVKAYQAGSSQQPYPPPPQSAYPPPPQSAYPPPPQTSYPPPSAAAGKHQGEAYPPPKYETPYAAAPPATAYPPQGVPVQGYPQGGPAAPYGYPPQQAYGGGGGVYPPQGYPQGGGYCGGYPPQQGGYGYPQQVVQPAGQAPKKNKFGMGLGAGLLGGALGGLLIGDMVSDSYDGYDGGYDDGGGFDF